jgi:hypothetical protein
VGEEELTRCLMNANGVIVRGVWRTRLRGCAPSALRTWRYLKLKLHAAWRDFCEED